VIRLLEKSANLKIGTIVAKIRNGDCNVYEISRKFFDSIRKDHSPYTVYVHRSRLVIFWYSVLGEENFSKRTFDRLVPTSPAYIVRFKKVPTLEQFRQVLRIANPQYRAILAFLACTGMRIGEVLSRKKSDIEIRKEGYAVVRLPASETKARYRRYGFLTKEVLGMISDYHSWLGSEATRSEYVFPGCESGFLEYHGVLEQVKTLYKRCGLNDAPDKSEIYCIHSLRTFAGDYMRRLGLGEKFVLAIIGHKNKLGAESHYVNWDEVERSWVEHCADRLSFLDTAVVVNSKVAELTRTNGKLEALLEKLLERLT